MELNWITPQQAAEKWSISDRRVQALCANGQVDGAVRLGRGWLIPKNTLKPVDGRMKNRLVSRKNKVNSNEGRHG
jgi:excisionase family DNA binding protein